MRPLNFTVSSHVSRLHLIVTAALALSGAGLLLGFLLNSGPLVGISVVLGWASTTTALMIALVLLILLGYRSLGGRARPLLNTSWLGLVNGALAASAWVYSVH